MLQSSSVQFYLWQRRVQLLVADVRPIGTHSSSHRLAILRVQPKLLEDMAAQQACRTCVLTQKLSAYQMV